MLMVMQAAAAKPGGTREKLPIFPLGIVALPAADVPLQIFEVRCLVGLSTRRQSMSGFSRVHS
jgi:Lon protease-like protein